MITSSLNKANVNIMDHVEVTHHADGGAYVRLDKQLVGHSVNFTPLPNGLMELTFKDPLNKVVEFKSNGVCHEIKLCGWQDLK